jgi:hypothetical protein
LVLESQDPEVEQHLAGGVKLALIGNNLGVIQSGLTTGQKLTFLSTKRTMDTVGAETEIKINQGRVYP